jgi:hypothetical protein
MQLAAQLHVSFVAELFPTIAPITNRDFFIKPNGGLWTSTLVDGSSAWVEWCRAEEFGEPDAQHWYVLEPDPAARVYIIDSLADLNRLIAMYPHPDKEQRLYSRFFGYIDFEAVSQDYDAIHLTEAGQWATRYSEPSLNGWDCESTVWFRWCFTSIEQFRTIAAALDERPV